MEKDGGGWTLVSHEIPRGGKLIVRNEVNLNSLPWNYGEGGVFSSPLSDPVGEKYSAKMPDDFINNIRTKNNQLSYIGYRTTSNDMKTTYFHHEDCPYYHHTSNNHPQFGNGLDQAYFNHEDNPCYRYTTKIDATPDDWVQCKAFNNGHHGGISCWYACNWKKTGVHNIFTNVVATSMQVNDNRGRASSITDNPTGKEMGSRDHDWGNDLLVWVR